MSRQMSNVKSPANFEITKNITQSLLLTLKRPILLNDFECLYYDLIGENIPFRELGYPTVKSLIHSMLDVISVYYDASQNLVLRGKADCCNKHIRDLVQNQKDTQSKRKFNGPGRNKTFTAKKAEVNPKQEVLKENQEPRKYSNVELRLRSQAVIHSHERTFQPDQKSCNLAEMKVGVDTHYSKVDILTLAKCTWFHCSVGEIYSPFNFYLLFNGKNDENLQMLTQRMTDFYEEKTNADKWRILALDVVFELPVVVAIDDRIYRGIVTSLIDVDKVEVFLIDSGSNCVILKNSLFYMHREFCKLPAQAINARLHGVRKRARPANIVQKNASLRLLELVNSNSLYAQIIHINAEESCVSVQIIDAEPQRDICINDSLVFEGYLRYCREQENGSRESEMHNGDVITDCLESSPAKEEVLQSQCSTSFSLTRMTSDFSRDSFSNWRHLKRILMGLESAQIGMALEREFVLGQMADNQSPALENVFMTLSTLEEKIISIKQEFMQITGKFSALS